MLEILSVMGWVSVVIGLGVLIFLIVWRLSKKERDLGIGWADVLFWLISVLVVWQSRLSVPPIQDSPEEPLTQEEHEWLDRQW